MIEIEPEINMIQIYNDISDMNEEKIEKYMNSTEWNELDKFFDKITSENEDYQSHLLDILSYGEISRAKFNAFLSNIPEKIVIREEFLLIPIFLDMSYDLAVSVITDWKSDDEEKRKIANETIYDYHRDQIIEFLLKTSKDALIDDNFKLAAEIMKELYDMGKYILPRIRLSLSIHETCYAFFRNITTIIMLLSVGEEKAVDLIHKVYDNKNEKMQIIAREEIKNIIIEIDTSSYCDRHPFKFHELNKSKIW